MTEKNLAPVVLFVYNRPEHTLKTIAALKANGLALQTDLFVYADGARSPAQQPSVDAVRECIADIKGFKSVTVNEAKVIEVSQIQLWGALLPLCSNTGR